MDLQLQVIHSNINVGCLISKRIQDTICNESVKEDYAKKFKNIFDNDREGMNQLSNLLTSRVNRMEEFVKELETANLDTILFKNRLAREISDASNDLKEAQSNILVLMNDRLILKDQFCLFNMKIKKLKSFNKSFQEDLQAYSNI